jgi:hypothetical protein
VLEKLEGFTKKVSDLPDKPNTQLTAVDIKSYFDAAPEELRQALNQVIIALQSKVSGDSGANNIGITPFDGSPSDIQSALVWLKQQINTMVLGQIPDRSIQEIKLTSTVGEVIRGNSQQPLIIEVRDSDPQTPVIGQMWLRRDL